MRWLLAFAAAFLLAGCGPSTPERAGAPVVPDAPPPAIAAVNEAPPEDVAWFLQSEFGLDAAPGDSAASGQGFVVCNETIPSGSELSPPPDVSGNSCPQPTAEEQARWTAAEQQYEQLIRPAPGSEPRVIARLPLDRSGDDLLFTAWKNGSGETCWQTDESGPDGGGGSGVSGPCEQQAEVGAFAGMAATRGMYATACDVICLGSDSRGDGNGADSYVLTGTVPRDAEALRVTMAGGTTATYPLVGPRVLDTARNVFMLDLGAHDWRKLELIRGGAVTATVEMPAFITAYEECGQKVGPPPDPPADADPRELIDSMKPYQSALTACLAASGAVPALGLPQVHFP